MWQGGSIIGDASDQDHGPRYTQERGISATDEEDAGEAGVQMVIPFPAAL